MLSARSFRSKKSTHLSFARHPGEGIDLAFLGLEDDCRRAAETELGHQGCIAVKLFCRAAIELIQRGITAIKLAADVNPSAEALCVLDEVTNGATRR